MDNLPVVKDSILILFVVIMTAFSRVWVPLFQRRQDIDETRNVETANLVKIITIHHEGAKASAQFLMDKDERIARALSALTTSVEKQTTVLTTLRDDVRNAVGYARSNGFGKAVNLLSDLMKNHNEQSQGDSP